MRGFRDFVELTLRAAVRIISAPDLRLPGRLKVADQDRGVHSGSRDASAGPPVRVIGLASGSVRSGSPSAAAVGAGPYWPPRDRRPWPRQGRAEALLLTFR